MSESAYKEQATRLRIFLAKNGIEIKHTHALEAVAQMHGYKNWHVLQAAKENCKSAPSSRTVKVTVDVPAERHEAFVQLWQDFLTGETAQDQAIRQRATDREQSLTSLRTLVKIAQGDSGQCRYIARFLAGLYNGPRFPFDLTDLRAIDDDLFEHCLAVLRLDHRPKVEVHDYFPNGSALWEKDIIDSWNLDMAAAMHAASLLSQFLHREWPAHRPLAEQINAWRDEARKDQ